LTRANCPKDYSAIQGYDPGTVLIRGGSCIVDPMGTVLVEPIFDRETIQFAELDRRLIAKGKYDLDVVGHYARPDVFKLTVDTSARQTVVFGNTGVQHPGTAAASVEDGDESI
jgi:nitrilase